MVKLIKDTPKRVIQAGGALWASSIALVSLGFKCPDVPKYLWFYIYDESLPPARVYAPSLKSSDNVPAGKSSLQLETYFSKHGGCPVRGDLLLEDVVRKAVALGWFAMKDMDVVDVREIEYGNVVFDKNMERHRGIVHDFLAEQDVIPIGRFGEWAYLWSDQSLLSGMRGVAKVMQKKA
jgi:hypothetical protein